MQHYNKYHRRKQLCYQMIAAAGQQLISSLSISITKFFVHNSASKKWTIEVPDRPGKTVTSVCSKPSPLGQFKVIISGLNPDIKVNRSRRDVKNILNVCRLFKRNWVSVGSAFLARLNGGYLTKQPVEIASGVSCPTRTKLVNRSITQSPSHQHRLSIVVECLEIEAEFSKWSEARV